MATTNPTLKDIAQRVGVSKNAVARVLLGTGGKNTRVGEETASRIRKVARQINYRPNRIAQQLAGRSTKMIGVVADSRGVEAHQRLLEMIERVAHRHGYGMMVGQAWGEIDRIQRYLEDFQARRVDGMICFSHNYPGHGMDIERMFAGLDNVVFVWPPFEPMRAYSTYATVDHADGVEQLVEHLYAIGRRRIGLLIGDLRWHSNSERLVGYRRAHERLGMPLQSALQEFTSDDPMEETVCRGMAERCLNANADALLCSNDVVAMKVIRYLVIERALRIPEDVAVTGFDNTQSSSICIPSLTTVDMQIQPWAETIVELLLERIEGKKDSPPRQEIIRPKLVTRESTLGLRSRA